MSGVFKVYASTDAGAPTLSGIAGALAALLDAVLVDGYGSGLTAKPPAGWTRTFSATHKRVYRNDPLTGTGYYLRVDDTAAIGNARHAFLRGYESVSDIDTGINPIPTAAQLVNGALWPKSTLLDGTARPWAIVANNKTAYLFFDGTGIGVANATPHFIGDGFSHKLGDRHFFMVSASETTAFTGATNVAHTRLFSLNGVGSPISTSSLYIARARTGIAGAVSACNLASDTWSGATYGRASVAYPDPVSNGLIHGSSHVLEAANTVRGKMPGLIVPQHDRPLSDMAVLPTLIGADGVSAVAKNFRTGAPNASTGDGQVLFDLTTEW